MEDDERQKFLATLGKSEKDRIRWFWDVWSRPQQRAPQGDWQTWLLLAGRGFGKTRSGAEWVREMARRHPEARIALIASSLGEARRVMVEGESGLLAVARPEQRPLYESSLRKLTWPNGAQAQLYSAAEAESLRGPQHSHASGAGAEGSFRQRGVGPNRCAPARPGRRRRQLTTNVASRWGLLGRWGKSAGRLGGESRQHRLPCGGQLAVRSTPGRNVRDRKRQRPDHAISHGPVVLSRCRRGPARGGNRRFPGADRHLRPARKAGRSRPASCRLSAWCGPFACKTRKSGVFCDHFLDQGMENAAFMQQVLPLTACAAKP
jgi:hypothetical protein